MHLQQTVVGWPILLCALGILIPRFSELNFDNEAKYR